MKHTSYLLVLLLAALTTLTGCNGDGNETIALEYGNPRQMIIGQWIVGPGTRVWIFTPDGYYTDSQDGGQKHHSWKLDSGASDGEPYYGGIWLDGVHYDIEVLGDGIWRLKGGDGSTIELVRDGGGGSGDSGQDGQGGQGGQGSQGSQDSGGKGKLVSGITITSSSTRAGSKYQTIKFFYDNNNRVKAVEYGGNEEIVIGPQGAHLDYLISGNTLTLSGYDLNNPSDVHVAQSKGTLNSHGYLEMEYFEANAYEISSNDYLIHYYEHNSKDQVTRMRVVESDTRRDSDVYDYTWSNDCMVKVTGNPGGAGYSTFSYSTIENKANINLNRMIYDQMYTEDIFALALCGYISAKEKYLVKGEWKLDSSGYPVSITTGGYTYSVSYTE